MYCDDVLSFSQVNVGQYFKTCNGLWAKVSKQDAEKIYPKGDNRPVKFLNATTCYTLDKNFKIKYETEHIVRYELIKNGRDAAIIKYLKRTGENIESAEKYVDSLTSSVSNQN